MWVLAPGGLTLTYPSLPHQPGTDPGPSRNPFSSGALCFQPGGLRWMPGVRVAAPMAGQAGVAFSPRSETLGSFSPVSGAYPGGICSRRHGCPHVWAPPFPPLAPHWKPGALWGSAGARGQPQYYTKCSLSQRPGQNGAERSPPNPQVPVSWVLKKDPFLSDTRNRKGPGSAHGCVCSLLPCLNCHNPLPGEERLSWWQSDCYLTESGCTDPAQVGLWRAAATSVCR